MTNDRATLLALELIRRQLGGLPGEFARALADMDATQAMADAAPKSEKRSDPLQARIDGFDTTMANTANRLAAQGWPKVIQLVNLLLQYVTKRALGAPDGPRMIAAPREGIPLEASGTAAARAAAANATKADDRAYLDRAADALRKLRAAVGNRTSKAFGAATSYVGRNARRFTGRMSDAWQRSRPGRAFMREWGSRTARGMRAGGAKLAGKAARGAKAVGGGVGKMLTAALAPFSLKLLAVLGPMALLAATLTQATSGFQLIISSAKLLASSLAPVLLPFAFMLAVALASISDVIWSELAPNLKDWYRIIVGEMIPKTKELIDGFKDLISAVKWIVEVAKNPSKAINTDADSGGEGQSGWDRTKGVFSSAGDLLKWGSGPVRLWNMLTGGDEQQTVTERRMRTSAAPGGDAPASAIAAAGQGTTPKIDPTELIRRNMADTLKELQMSIGPKASFQGLAQASKSAQLAALNQSPYEAKMLERMQTVLGALTKVVDNTTKQPTPRHTGGSNG